jgi:hypothetical protein
VLIIYAAGDGVFSVNTGTFIQLTDLKSNTTRNLVALQNVKDVSSERTLVFFFYFRPLLLTSPPSFLFSLPLQLMMIHDGMNMN